MKILNLLMWVGQFGVSIIFPMVFFMLSAVWLRGRFGLGMWIFLVFGVLGILTTVSTVKSCLRSLQKAAEEASGDRKPVVGFNDHN